MMLAMFGLQIDLGEVKEVTGVITQGSPVIKSLVVKVFAVQLSSDGAVWQEVRDHGKDFAKVHILILTYM